MTYIYPFLSQPCVDGVRTPEQSSILTFDYDADSTCIAMVNRVGKSGYQRDYDATAPIRPFAMRTNDAMDKRVANIVLNGNVIHHSSTP